MSKTFKKTPKNRRFDDYNDFDDDRRDKQKRERERQARREERALRTKDVDALMDEDE